MLVVSFTLLAVVSTAAPDAAVLVVGRGGAFDTQAADDVRGLLRSADPAVLDKAATAQRLHGAYVPPPADRLVRLRHEAEQAKAAFGEFEIERAVSGYREVVGALADEVELSDGERALLQQTRVDLAVALLAVADPEETGRAESLQGQDAIGFLENAFREDPAMNLDAARYPPKVRTLLNAARANVQRQGLGGLEVRSNPTGVTVMVEGRPVGTTPLRLFSVLPPGRVRLWLEHKGRRTAARWVEVKRDNAVPVVVDAALDVTLWPQGAGVWLTDQQALDSAYIDKLRALLEVERLVMVGQTDHHAFVVEATGDGPPRLALAPRTADAKALRDALGRASPTYSAERPAFVLPAPGSDPPAPPDAAVPVASPGPGADGDADAPPAVAAPAVDEEAGEDEGGAGVWVWTGVGVGGAAALVAAAVVAAGATAGVLFWQGYITPDGQLDVAPRGKIDVTVRR